MKQTAYLGRDSINELVPLIMKCNAKHVFLVRGRSSYRVSGAEQIISDAHIATGCHFTEFYDFSENPKCEDMERGIELLKKCDADLIIAVGGGSVLDMAKLVRFFYSYRGDVIGKSFEKTRNLLPLVAMPTTAGTGAEATHFAVVYKNKIKYSVEHEYMLPDYAIVYPPFTYNNPKYLTACTGFDALAQSIEAYWNRNAVDESDIYAERAIKLLWANLPEVVNNPTNELRDKIAEGAYWAGRAINITKTTAPHAFSYPFTSYYGYPHGHAVALTFSSISSYNLAQYSRRDDILSMLGCSLENVEKYMDVYIRSIGLGCQEPQSIDIDLILSNVNLDRLKNNPVEIDSYKALDIVSKLKVNGSC